MKTLCAFFISGLFFVPNAFPQAKKEASSVVPRATTIKITLIGLPGVRDEKSKWELAYELRIANDKELEDAEVDGRLYLNADKKLGEFIGKGNFTKNGLSDERNRQVILTFPLDEKIQKKLSDELEGITKPAVAQNKNAFDSSVERKNKTQNFLVYGNALIYDAKLKKNIIVPFNWILSFTRYTEFANASFEITLQINENGEFTRTWVLPKKPKNSMTVSTKQ